MEGYLIFKDEKNKGEKSKAIYLYTKAGLNNYGLKFLKLFKKNKLESFFEKENENDNLQMGMTGIVNNYIDIDKQQYIRSNSSNKNNSFVTYAYEFIKENNVLNVYFEGNLLFEIVQKEIEIYEYIFENFIILKNIIKYNEKKCDNSKKIIISARKFFDNNNMESMKKLIEERKNNIYIDSEVFELKQGKSNSYIRKIFNYRDQLLLKFKIKQKFSQIYQLELICPWGSLPIYKGTTSKASCEKRLRDLVTIFPDELKNTQQIFSIYSEFKCQINKLSYNYFYKSEELLEIYLQKATFLINNCGKEVFFDFDIFESKLMDLLQKQRHTKWQNIRDLVTEVENKKGKGIRIIIKNNSMNLISKRGRSSKKHNKDILIDYISDNKWQITGLYRNEVVSRSALLNELYKKINCNSKIIA